MWGGGAFITSSFNPILAKKLCEHDEMTKMSKPSLFLYLFFFPLFKQNPLPKTPLHLVEGCHLQSVQPIG